MSNAITVNETSFEQEVLQSDIPVLVDFWAEWCAPCKMIAPMLDALANEMSGNLKVAKINVDSNQNLAARYDVRSIPTLLLIVDGVVKDQIGPGLSQKDLRKRIETHI
jgi:thioredoxin 1